ncbi:M14-type cytosolic carboxypeptidase [Alsobacter sp. SYSU M60028]|uniref:M14-type cytosolic carboxypeptidase n=1 Tax=Alsobacter ponti TaxID=2962936 RepID=A0ABT1LCG4_9HYPH|nr:M14-type cytosolic carboxypeptidase [Alsobacter ponti]MCP8937938.1 M14-type cytosolic carboxypeptidase [Alsobacter ponti]
MIRIDSQIPSGRIEVLDASDPADIRLAVPKDPNCDLMGWYHFRASGVRGVACRFSLVNAGESLKVRLPNREDYEDRWTNTGPVASYDRVHWFRLKAEYDGMAFSFRHTPEHDLCYYGLWAPFPLERDHAMIARAQVSPRVRLETVAHSVEGRAIDMLTVGEPGPGKRVCWVIARQHPSETQGGYFLEGLFDRLLDPDDATTTALLDAAVLHIVPNMNPDGTANGFSRSNALGVNLNREWVSPSPERSPEVFGVRSRMEEIGVDFCIDCHADAELTCNFIWPSENVPSWTPERRAPFTAFETAWAAANPDYELGHPYPGGVPKQADLSMAWNWIGERFPHALSVLLEQPFKDVSWRKTPETGWSPARARRLGESFPAALLAALRAM